MLPPVVIYQFGGYRTGLLIYLEVLAVVLVAKFLKQRQCKRAGLIAFAIIIGVISEWRSENIIYMILGIIAIVALTKNTIPERLAAIVLCIVVFGSIHRVEKNYMGSSYYYLIRSSILPAVELMKAADPVRDQEEIRKMAPIIHPEILKENPNADGYYVWDQERIYEIDISKKMYDDYMDGMVQLAFKYPHVLWKERSDRFAGAIGLRGSTVQVSSVSYAVHLMDIGQNEWYEAWRATEHSGIRPVFPEVRKHFIYLLGQQKPDTIPEPLFYVFWNGIIPTAFVLMAFFYAIVKRRWILFLISGFFLAKTVIIFAAESGSLFMYYLPQYVVGYMLLSAGIVMLLSKGRTMKNVV